MGSMGWKCSQQELRFGVGRTGLQISGESECGLGFFWLFLNPSKPITDYSIPLKCQCASVDGNVDEMDTSVMQRCLDCVKSSFLNMVGHVLAHYHH